MAEAAYKQLKEVRGPNSRFMIMTQEVNGRFTYKATVYLFLLKTR